MKDILSGGAAALLITCALSATISCGDVDRKYDAHARDTASGGSAGKASANSGGTRAGGTTTGGSAPVTLGGQSASGGSPLGAGGSAPGTGDPSLGTAGSSPGAAGSSPGAAGSSPGAAGSSPTTCTGQSHMCLGNCVSNSSVDHCGGSCDPCQVPSGATATCDGNQCGFNCGSLKKCGSKCIPSDGCCSDGDCPAQNGMARQCDTSSNTCKASGCASGFKPCGNACIANNACCSNNDCGGTCQACSGGTCVSVKNADDTDSCNGTCDGNGTCKSKRGQACNTVAGGCIGGSPCVDNYCCESACSGQCQACDINGKQGTCSPVPSGAPHGTRTACTSDGTKCGGSCNGKSDGTCDYRNDDCGDASCVKDSKNMFQDHGTCKAGKCQTPDPRACASSLICSNNACLGACTKTSDCMSGFECDTSTKKCQSAPKEVTIYSDAAHSGTVSTNGVVTTNKMNAGDDAANNGMCFFVAFDTSQIPKGSVIESATLVINHGKPVGSPTGALNAQKMVKPCNTIEVTCLTANGGETVQISTGNGEGQKQASVKTSIADDVKAGQTTTQFRFCMAKLSNNSAADIVDILDSGAVLRPNLTIAWRAP